MFYIMISSMNLHALLILYYVIVKLSLLFNSPCFNTIIYWIEPWFNTIMSNSCYFYKFHDIPMIVLNHELQVFYKMPTRVIDLIKTFMLCPPSVNVLLPLLFWSPGGIEFPKTIVFFMYSSLSTLQNSLQNILWALSE